MHAQAPVVELMTQVRYCVLEREDRSRRQKEEGTDLGARQAGDHLVQAGARAAAQRRLQRAQHLRGSRKIFGVLPYRS